LVSRVWLWKSESFLRVPRLEAINVCGGGLVSWSDVVITITHCCGSSLSETDGDGVVPTGVTPQSEDSVVNISFVMSIERSIGDALSLVCQAEFSAISRCVLTQVVSNSHTLFSDCSIAEILKAVADFNAIKSILAPLNVVDSSRILTGL
jgi:hypothetical protein